ncbi:hypothetical protein B0T24DRAFT_615556 [Lasiosphaeria ovina]|uniref:BRCT domain-containing protein n=1 Tax=Lasiosphaeria ovina TaxID=92902 RepID=A0AAE0NFE6_9PEZI|nr:hypothetical protein B0T24DRAFT_615556 [Lasiosphaeria ovina]
MATTTPPQSSDAFAETSFDSAHPFRSIVICATSIPPDLRTDIAAKVVELGGIHKYDLTPDCTHLLVGEYDTPKYRHVAKERPDIKVMAPGWVEAVRDLWVQDVEIDFAALEKGWQLRVFETGVAEATPADAEPERGRLLCCMTGFEDQDVREHISETIRANGGEYTGDLTRRVTHLIVFKPQGRKYQAAKTWGIQTVSIRWVEDSVKRGMILDEKCYDPTLPEEEIGMGALVKKVPEKVALGKRLRESSTVLDDGRRKLRKTASMKLNSQRDNLWGDILGKPQTTEPLAADAAEATSVQSARGAPKSQASVVEQASAGGKSMDTQLSRIASFGVSDGGDVFSSCCFYVHGFSEAKTAILVNAVASLGGLICQSLDEVVSASGAQLAHRFLIVPQSSPPESHPRLPDNVHITTEFYIERCMHKNRFFHPSDHVIGRPFLAFPIEGFESLSISTAGFTGVDLNHVDKTIRQLGARYEEKFTADVSLLVCSSLSSVRKQKLDLALAWKVPVVNAEWLWDCITTGFKAPIKAFLSPELRQNLDGSEKTDKTKGADRGAGKARVSQDRLLARDGIDKDLLAKSAAKPKTHRETSFPSFSAVAKEIQRAPGTVAALPPTAAKDFLPPAPAEGPLSNATTALHFETARTHQPQTGNSESESGSKSNTDSATLSETSPNALNKTVSSPRKQGSQRKPMSRVTSEIADSEATDGDLCQPSDVEDENGPAELAVEEEDPDVARKRVETQLAALKAAENKELTDKLALTVLDSALATAGPSGANEREAGGASGAGAGSGIHDSDGGGGDTAVVEGPAKRKRRKREILGRAISNVSAASSTSGAAGADSGGGGSLSAAARDTDGGDGEGGRPPPATQLDYQDPDAKRFQEQVMHKMLGTVAGKKGSARYEVPTLAWGQQQPPGTGERRSRRR